MLFQYDVCYVFSQQSIPFGGTVAKVTAKAIRKIILISSLLFFNAFLKTFSLSIKIMPSCGLNIFFNGSTLRIGYRYKSRQMPINHPPIDIHSPSNSWKANDLSLEPIHKLKLSGYIFSIYATRNYCLLKRDILNLG